VRYQGRKIGRNEPCPCGSGQKYKRCHGLIAAQEQPQRGGYADIANQAAFQEAMRVQREKQQGLGRPIISAEASGTRFVAVKNRLMHSKKWKTFIDFLGDYIKTAIGSEWGNSQIKKPLHERHPILQWYDKICARQRMYIKKEGTVYSSPMAGVTLAYYGLAYDLYCLDHNAELQRKLIERLKSSDNFFGARYEVQVAAMLIRAGFEIEFEDENKRGSTHCEYTATSRITGKKFSVECKHRESGVEAGQKAGEIKLSKLGRTLRSALLKKANYDRIVFIDLNFPCDPTKNKTYPAQMNAALHHIKKFENNPANGGDLPPACVFMTNMPAHHHLDAENVSFAICLEGFKIPELQGDKKFSLHDAIALREKHKDIGRLLKSTEGFARIPTTFDGEIPEFAFGDAKQRLLVGRHYLIKDKDGNDRVAVLTSATVMEQERKAFCALTLESGESHIGTWPLSDEEMVAYKAYPDTFFGEVSKNRRADHPLEMYDFFLEGYANTPKEKILEFFKGRPNIEELKKLSQPELAKMYAEHCTSWVLAKQQEDEAKKAAKVVTEKSPQTEPER
jgi:hypothetical protein